MARNKTPTEFQEQKAFCEYLDIKAAQLKGFKYTAIPNGTYTNSWTAKRKAKLEGVKKGFPDLIIFYNNGKDNLLIMEMKRQKGGVLSEEQKEWIEWLDENDYCVCRANGNQHAQILLDKFIKGDY